MSHLKNLERADLDFLINALGQDVKPVKSMTRNYYFRAVKYAISGIDGSVLKPNLKQKFSMQQRMQNKAERTGVAPGLFMSDDVFAYNKYTECWVGDAIDNFGTITRPDCPVDFAKWYDVYAYNGGHPFEIYPYICLYVRNNSDGFYLELTDFVFGDGRPSEKLIKMYLALQRANVSVALCDRDLLLKKLQKYNLLNR